MSAPIFDLNENHADFLHDESRSIGHAERIVFPQSTQEVCEIVERSDRITIQGGRTGITGGAVPNGGTILNLSRMRNIGKIEAKRITVGAGVTLSDLRAALDGSDLFFPPDPTETTATLGGMVACNASGARSFRYGAVRNWIQEMEVVLPHGELVRIQRGRDRTHGLNFKLGSIEGKLPIIQSPCVKNAAGYFLKPDMDLVDLFIGAEGTLGVVTEITLQLLPKPPLICGLLSFFASEKEALDFVQFLRSVEPKTEPLAIEFFGFQSLELLRRSPSVHPSLSPDFHTGLYFEFNGEVPKLIEEKVSKAIDCWFAEGEEEIETLKKFRHALPEAINQVVSTRKMVKLGTDMAVPDSKLETVMHMYRAGLAKTELQHALFGHIGNNHLHVNILPRNAAEYEKGKTLYLEWAQKIVAMGGTVSAEHGIGKLKTEFLELMYGAAGIEKMRNIKRLFDPKNRLNVGNLFR